MRFPFDVIGFDLDGTLADTSLDLCAALNHALVQVGREGVDPESVRHMVGHGAGVLIERGLASTGGFEAEAAAAALPAFLDFYAANICVHTTAYEGVADALAELDGMAVRLAICTNKPAALAETLVAALGWRGRFRAVIGGDSLPFRKPDGRTLHETFARAGGGRAAFVGDSIADTQAARNAGVPCVALSFGFSDRPAAELGAGVVVDHWRAVVPALARL